jgi:hypothetical protein
MEIQNGRRGFVKGFGLFSAMLAGAAVVRAESAAPQLGNSVVPIPNSSAVSEAVDPAIISLIEEQATNHLQLTHTYGDIAPPPPPVERMRFCSDGSVLVSNWATGGTATTWATPSFLQINANGGVNIGGKNKPFVPGTENEVSVKMVVGPDGELYLKMKDQWKRVLTT